VISDVVVEAGEGMYCCEVRLNSNLCVKIEVHMRLTKNSASSVQNVRRFYNFMDQNLKPKLLQPVKFPASYGTKSFNALFTRTRHLSVS
jgi:hypothetical protein